MEVILEMLDILIGKLSIVVSLGKLTSHITTGLQRQQGLHYVKARHILVCQLGIFGPMDIFLNNHHAFLKKEFIDGILVLLMHKHCGGCHKTFKMAGYLFISLFLLVLKGIYFP